MAIITGTNLADILIGTSSTDTIYGGNGDDILIGEQKDLIYSNIAGVILPTPSITFSGDFLYGGNGSDKVYGDLVNLTFEVVAGPEVSQTFGGVSILSPITVVLGNDFLDGGNDNDLLVGDVDTILLKAKATLVTEALPLGNADAILQNISMTMGVDTLYGGNGNDTLYGDVRVVTLESIAGTANDPTAGAQTASTRIQGITFQGGVDNLYGGNGDDFLYGDIGTLNLLSQAGDALGTGDQAISRLNGNILPNKLTMGGDFLYGDNGNDTLYGDMGTMNLTAIGGTTNGGSFAQSQIVGNTFTMGTDELHGGNGDDKLYGDVGALTLFGQGGTSVTGSTTAFIQPVTFNPDTFPDLFNMGNDFLYGEEGNDRIVGDIGTLTLQSTGLSTSGAASSNSQIKGTFLMGRDTLDGGRGNDTIWGDVANLSIIGQGGIVSDAGIGAVGLVGSELTMGVDTLIGGDGDDHLYGDVGAFRLSMAAGTVTSTSTNPNAESSAGEEGVYSLVVTMGVDNLVGGNGDDFLYGDVDTFSISLTGGTNSGASSVYYAAFGAIFDSTFSMGDDTLEGGSGNDQLYGDLGTFSAILTPGTGIGTTPLINNTDLKFGNDTLIGGSGNDILVGDIANPAQLNGFLNAPFSPDTPIANQVIFGNDTFVFSLGGANGNDIIKDMNGGATSTSTCIVTNVMDTLKFTNVTDVGAPGLNAADVDAASTFSNSGGHLLMSFAGGSVLFENINYNSQPSWTSVSQITPNVIVV